MDEVENPDLPAAGEASPTLRPVDNDEDVTAALERPGDADIEPGSPSNTYSALQTGELNSPFSNRPPSPASAAAVRPSLSRGDSVPPPQQPPPATPGQPSEHADSVQDPPDSLTLAELKRIRSTFPTAPSPQKQQLLDYEQVYDFEYRDAQSFPCELEEWFSYSEEEERKLRKCREVFVHEWEASEWGSSDDGKSRKDWLEVTEDSRRAFATHWINTLQSTAKAHDVTHALSVLTYIGLGIWEETAGRQEGCTLEDLFPDNKFGGSRLEDYSRSSLQIQWIVAMVDTLHSCNGLKKIYDTLRRVCDSNITGAVPEVPSRNESQPRRGDESMDLWCSLTLMYLFVEVARTTTNAQMLKDDVLTLEPDLLNYLTQIVAKLRWDEHAPVPLTKMLLLAWKTILVTFGGIKDVDKIKASLRESEEEIDVRGQPVITASPLDYHLFRQEISSKYPAYQPPPPLFPLEPENNSILPPLKHRRPSYTKSIYSSGTVPAVSSGSIMNQPVHIATPAPSPPPSPGGPGKAGKKQNYQTNQLFPFLYPPLDASSNELGGKGSTELQDALVGRKWEGSDIPTSILEAAELFAKRMRATKGMKQMWEVRVDFMKQERGWKQADDPDFTDIEETKAKSEPPAESVDPSMPEDVQRLLSRIRLFYRDCLPHLQSVVIVLLKAVLQNVTDLVTKGNGQNGLQAGIHFNDGTGANGHGPLDNVSGQNNDDHESMVEANRQRSQEIAAKALSAILLLLLKWFKLSHILQYEYMTQLLTDSNYVPLILKLWQTHEIGRACHFRVDRDDRRFFYLCRKASRHGPPSPIAAGSDGIVLEDSEDEAAPPPIKRKRDEPVEALPNASPSGYMHPPEVDELGYPTTPLPSKPLEKYSYRSMFSTINYLRILQKVTRRKTHRALLLVSYKSSQHLRKSLKVPIEMMRYYTLKLFKSQVPFCGRKWRQSNMKIITAVWLSIPAELRDDWLSGGGGGMGGACVGDVDGTVEDAVPLEQSLRNLTHWWNVRNFPDVMGVDKGLLDEEMDYFARELEKMEFLREEEFVEEQSLAEEPWHGPIEGY